MFLRLKIARAQAARGAIVDAGARDLQDAVLARHDAGVSEHHEAELHVPALRRDAFDLGERELGGEPCAYGSARCKRSHARNVMRRDAAAQLGDSTPLRRKRELRYGAHGCGGAGHEPGIEPFVIDLARDFVEDRDDAACGAVGRGEPCGDEVVNRHVYARCPGVARGGSGVA